MVLALNVGLVDPKYGSALENKPDDVDAEIEIAKAIRLRKMKQTPASEQKDPIFGVSMGETARAVKGENKTGVEGFVRGFAAKPFQMLGGIQDLGQMAAKDPLKTAKNVVVESAKATARMYRIGRGPTTPGYAEALAAEGADLAEQGAGGYTFDKLMQLAGAAGAGQGIATAVKVARAAKTAGGITKAFRAFTNGAIKAAPEITPEAAAKVFTEATEQAVTPEMLDALKGKFNKPVAGATSVGDQQINVRDSQKATPSTPPVEKVQMGTDGMSQKFDPKKAQEGFEKRRREWIDNERKTNPNFAPDIESAKELLTPEQLSEVNRYEDLMYKSVAHDNKYRPMKLSKSEQSEYAVLHDKYKDLFYSPQRAGKISTEPTATPDAAVRPAQPTAPTAKAKEPWEMTKAEFDDYWVNETRKDVAEEVEKNVSGLSSEIDRLKRGISEDSMNPANAGKLAEIERLSKSIEREQKRISGSFGKPSKFMSEAQSRYHRGIDQALSEGKPVPPEVLADYPDLAAKYAKPTTAEAVVKKAGESTELGSFGGPGTFKQLGETITRGIEKMGGGGKPKDAPGIRLDNINVSDDIKTNVKARLDDVSKQISDKKGAPLTHEEVLDRAVEADLLKGFIDREKTAEVAASLTRTQQNLAALAEQNPVGIDPEWAKQATRVSSMATDLGRRLNALKIPVKSELYEFKMKMIKELTDRGHDLDTIVRVFDGVDFTNAKAVGKAYKTLLPKMEKVRLWIDKFRYTNMLSGPKTHIINQTGNVLQSLVMRPVDRFNWGVLDFGRSKLTGAAREAYATDFIPYYRGFVGSAKDGAKMAFDVLRGKNKIEKPDLDLTQLPLGGAHTPVEVIPRLMEAADVFTRTMMEGAEMKLGASSGVARSTANTYLFRNLPDTANKTGQGLVAAVFDRATAVAEYLRKDFTIQSGGKPVHVWNPMKLMIPFVQTPMNILKEGMIARNPLLGSVNLVGNTAKMESVAKMMTGGMILAAAGAYAYNNRVSYTAPTSQKGKQMFYGAGLKPYSIITPDGHSVSMQRLGPVAYPFVLASATKWYFDKNPKAATESNLEKTSQVLTAYAKFLTDQSYMQGIGSVLDALEGEGKLVRAATGPARQFIPLSSLQSWVNDYFLDPVYRKPSNNFDAEGIAENMYRSMIGMSKKLEPYRDSEERKEKRQNPTLNAFSPVEISKINRDKRGEYNEYLAGQRERAIEKKQAR